MCAPVFRGVSLACVVPEPQGFHRLTQSALRLALGDGGAAAKRLPRQQGLYRRVQYTRARVWAGLQPSTVDMCVWSGLQPSIVNVCVCVCVCVCVWPGVAEEWLVVRWHAH